MMATNETVDYAELMGTIVGQQQKIEFYERALNLIAYDLISADEMGALAQEVTGGGTDLLQVYEKRREEGR